MKHQKFKIWLPLAMLVLSCGILLSYSGYRASLAYLQAERTAVNEFKAGTQKTEIVEEFPDPDIPEDYDPEDREYTIHKKVSVKNVGDVPCYIRVSVEPTSNLFEIVRYEGSNISTDLNTTEPVWYDNGDGYYYYTAVLNPEETSKPVFTDVVIWVQEDWNDIDADKVRIDVSKEDRAAELFTDVLSAFSVRSDITKEYQNLIGR